MPPLHAALTDARQGRSHSTAHTSDRLTVLTTDIHSDATHGHAGLTFNVLLARHVLRTACHGRRTSCEHLAKRLARGLQLGSSLGCHAELVQALEQSLLRTGCERSLGGQAAPSGC